MIPALAPILNAKWQADPVQPDWFWGVDAEGNRFLMTAPPPVRDLIVLMQNNAVMEKEYEQAKTRYIERVIRSANRLLKKLDRPRPDYPSRGTDAA